MYYNTRDTVSKVARICQRDAYYQTYIDAEIACQVGGESYNILTDAVFVNGMVFASFSKSDGLFESVICFKDIQQLNSSLVDEKLNFIDGNCTLNETQSYLAYEQNMEQCENLKGNTSIFFEEFKCAADMPHLTHDSKRVIGNKSILFNYSIHNIEGKITKLFTTSLNGKSIILAGTESGHVIQFSILEDGSLQKYDTSRVPSSSSREDNKIHDLYHFPDGDAFYALTKSKIFKISARPCTESDVSVCTQSVTMKMKDPHCGWCVFKNKLSKKSECNATWISLDKKCLISIRPQGVTVGERTVDITITSDSLPNASYICGINGGQGKARKNSSSLTCSVNVSEISANHRYTTFGLYEETKNVLVAEAPFLFFNCSVYSKCSTCVETISGTCRWCASQGHCESTNTTTHCGNHHSVNNSCPMLKQTTLYLHANVEYTLKLEVENTINITTDLKNLSVKINSTNIAKQYCQFSDGKVDCNVTFKARSDAKTLENIEVQYENPKRKWISIDGKSEVFVYKCTTLSDNMCNYCQALNTSRFRCKWDNETKSCTYCSPSETCRHECPRPNITEILPRDGFIGKGLLITVTGEEFGTNEEIRDIHINGKTCINETVQFIHTDISKSDDFSKNITKGFICKLDKKNGNTTYFYRVNRTGESLPVNDAIIPIWKNATITSIEPTSGPKAGGTMITLKGDNLGIGNRIISEVRFNDKSLCKSPKIYPYCPACIRTESVYPPFSIVCKTPNVTSTRSELKLEDVTVPESQTIELLGQPKFILLDNPVIEKILPQKGFLSGGTVLTVKGKNLNTANAGTVRLEYNSEVEKCVIDDNSSAQVLCKIPAASTGIVQELNAKTSLSINRKKRSSQCDDCFTVTIIVQLDEIEHSFNLSYFHDPSISKFEGVLLYQSDQQYLEIKGENLNLVAEIHDINVTIGLGECNVVELTGSYMRCKTPSSQPKPGIPGATLPEVNVTIGNIHTTVGFIQYQQKFENFLIIAGAAAGTALFLLELVVVFFVCMNRKAGSKAKALEKQINDLEMEIKQVAKEEFLDMQTSLSTVNRNLIEQGFPYHSYQQFACNAIFATDYLMSDPVVSSYKMSDELRANARTGMERFRGLLENKFFLVSLITTMDKQTHFFIKEKSNFAGNLCAIMMGRMDYMHEVLQVLITKMVVDPSSKRDVRSLFRRSESITEKLLSDWLSLCLYPHLKDHTGSLLYLLYTATRKAMESGPIDALTNDAKYTLSEEKLLRKYQGSATDEETTDVKFEAKALTLNVVVNNGDEIYPCKALDCDTVSQVKYKCLDQIYVNYPASQLPVDPTELLLEWHAGFNGRVILRDEDNTSKRNWGWIRVNTLAHYTVADQSNIALVDPRNAEIIQQDDYVDLAHFNIGFDDHSMDFDQPMTSEGSTSHDDEHPRKLKHWHLLKDEDGNKKKKSAIDELYLNRLITTKLSLVKYIDDLFSLVLESSKCPPPVKFLFDFLDGLAEKQKIAPDTLHAWKSHSYFIRIWAMLINTPSIMFDINAPSYVLENLDVISQVFIDSFSLTEQAVSKESPTQKLIFRNELSKYRTHVQEFYKNVQVNVQKPDELGQYLTSINRNQQKTTFNKNAALYRLYEQIKPYTAEILDDLSFCHETSCLQLNKKLENIFVMMEQ
ncbi:plexin-B-like isoform X2 [Mya arenaria]|uniref:plexin-B-like isoform X2 n=1 Tax=Mya arenaria TaxID=6604 RepID=UPI0022E81516|nr:plexin-B-like isoform X2 [Mya arenaria]